MSPDSNAPRKRYPGLEVLSSDPDNAQTDSRHNLEQYLTPREEHYIRNHHRTPEIDADEWSVSLTGMRPVTCNPAVFGRRANTPVRRWM